MTYQKVEYKLIDNYTGRFLWLKTDPKNWDESERTLKRSDKTYGIYTELSKNLIFTKEAAVFLKEAYTFRDIEADVTLEQYKFHPQTEVRFLYDSGLFDFSKYKESKLEVKIPFKSGGLNSLIQSQIKEKFELQRLDSINGKAIDPLSIVNVAFKSRDILLISKLETAEADKDSTAFRMRFTGANARTGSLGVPVNITLNSDAKLGAIIRDLTFTTTPNVGEIAQMFYYNNDVDKTIDLRIRVHTEYRKVRTNDLAVGFLGLRLAKFENGVTPQFKESITLGSFDPYGNSGQVIDVDYEDEITLLAGESLSLQWYGGGTFGALLDNGYLNADFINTKAIIDIVEDSQREDSRGQAVLYHEVGEKLMQIITGEKKRFKSNFYGRLDIGYDETAKYAMTATTLGLWIRQFEEARIEMSLNDYLDASNVIHNTGYTIEKVNGVEILVLEDLKFFFQDHVTIKLPNQVSKLERVAADDLADSSLTFGYKEGGEYEEAMGLDEYNVRNSYTTPLTRVDTKYEKVSPFRADPYGKEFARRKPRETFPEQDTRYDKDIHLLDLKEGLGLAYEERIWSDDFENEPLNVYSPETATNLRLTPANIKQRHEWFFGNALVKFPNDKIRFSNSDGNRSLITDKVGEPPLAENGDTLISELEKPKFVSQWITFDHEVNFDINQMVYGKTLINGREVPNYFGKVEFINEYNKKEYGYLFELKPDKEGKWKILKTF